MILENRLKYLQQATAQQENAVIGRIGTKPLELGAGGSAVQGFNGSTVGDEGGSGAAGAEEIGGGQ